MKKSIIGTLSRPLNPSPSNTPIPMKKSIPVTVSRPLGIFAYASLTTIVLLLAIGLPSNALGQARTWDNDTGDNLWFSGSNWSGNTAPAGSSNTGTIDANSSAGSPVVLTNGTTPGIGTVTLGSTLATSGYLNISTSGTLSLFNANSLIVGNGGFGSVTQTDASSRVTIAANGPVTLGALSTGVGVYALSSGTITTALNVGLAGSGTFNQTGGAVDTGGNNLVIGGSASGVGIYNISSGTSRSNTGGMILGNSGTGTVNQTGGQVGDMRATTIGNNVGAVGTYNISSGTFFQGAATTALTIGNNGAGTMNLSGGTVAKTGGNVVLGSGSTGVGNLSITATGAAFTFNTGGQMIVGASGTGTITQTSGVLGALTSGGGATMLAMTLGQNANSVGTYAFSGGVMKQTTASALIVGQSGTGTLNMSGSAAITDGGNITIGQDAGSVGAINLTGTGNISRATTATLTVGGTGSGTLNMSGNTVALAGTAGVMTVRSGSAGSGTVQGYGTFGIAGNLTMNGMMIADGKTTGNKTLDLAQVNGSADDGIIFNTIENTTNNGWYAQDQGMLILPTLSSAAGAGTQNWGESAFATDANIDLVNSAQLTYGASHTAGNLRIDLMANDRTEFSNLPADALPAVWNLDYTGTTFALTVFRVRYDDGAAGAAESSLLFYYSSNGSTWSVLGTTLDTSNNWATTSGVSLAEGYYVLAVPEPSIMALLVGAGMLVALRRRRASRA